MSVGSTHHDRKELTMTTRPNITLPKVSVKGDLTAVVVIDTTIELWYQAPNGDSSDSVIHHLYCTSNAQAEAIAKRHRDAWGI